MENVGPVLAKITVVLVGAFLAYQGAVAGLSGGGGKSSHGVSLPCDTCVWEEAYKIGGAGSLSRMGGIDESGWSASSGLDLGFSAQAPMFSLQAAGGLSAGEFPGGQALRPRDDINGWVSSPVNGAFGGGGMTTGPALAGASAASVNGQANQPQLVLSLQPGTAPMPGGSSSPGANAGGPGSGTSGTAPVPLPSGALLFGTGLLAHLAFAQLRRKAKNTSEPA